MSIILSLEREIFKSCAVKVLRTGIAVANLGSWLNDVRLGGCRICEFFYAVKYPSKGGPSRSVLVLQSIRLYQPQHNAKKVQKLRLNLSNPTGHQKNRSLLTAPIRTLYNLKFRLTRSILLLYLDSPVHSKSQKIIVHGSVT